MALRPSKACRLGNWKPKAAPWGLDSGHCPLQTRQLPPAILLSPIVTEVSILRIHTQLIKGVQIQACAGINSVIYI